MKKILIVLGILFLQFSANSQITLNEGFESWPPANWNFYLLGLADDGWRDDFNGVAHTGTGSAYSSIDNDQCDNWMVTPAVNIIDNTYELRFWEIHNSSQFYDKGSVLISSGSSDPLSGDFVEVFESNILNELNWEERVIDLSAYNGQTIYVAFRYEGTFHAWNIDDVRISPLSFTDGDLTSFIAPNGVVENPVTAPIIVEFENTGTTTVTALDITWEVNNVSQPTYTNNSLLVLPGQTANLNIGSYNFNAFGGYDITAQLNLANDFEPSNNQVETSFDISPFKDATITAINPQGVVPVNGLLEVKASVSNVGENTIDEVEIEWSVNGISQTPYTTTTLNLLPGESTVVTLGNYSFVDGQNTISATVDAVGDINASNDSFQSPLNVNVFEESFEGSQFPPEGWSINFGVRDDSNFDIAADGEYYYVAFTDNNFFGQVTDTIFTPLLDIKNGDKFRFYIKTAAPTPANHSLVYKDGVTGQVNVIQSIANNSGLNNWELRDLDISAAAGTNQIGIVTEFIGGFGESKFDFFSSDANLHLYDNDLRLLNGDLPFIVRQNTTETFTCAIRNAGNLPVLGSDYTVKLMQVPNTVLATVSGVDLNSWEQTDINIDHTFTNIDTNRLYFEIDYAIDQHTDDNTFREANVSVVPNTVQINAISSPDIRNGNIPFTANGNTNSLGEDDLSQLLFYNNEFSSAGLVYGIAYKYDNLLKANKIVNYPLQVWIGQTSLSNMDGGFLPNNNLILVFDGVVEILPDNGRDLYIPFNQPLQLNGTENVVIKTFQYDPDFPPSIMRFLGDTNNSGPTRSIGVADVPNLDPANPPTGFFSTTSTVYTRFVIDPAGSNGVLSGVVYDNSTNTPLENATITIEGSNITTQSDVNGNYSLPALTFGTYNITASFTGYADELISVNLNAATQTQDFLLNPLSNNDVTGTVYGSNDQTSPLESVNVKLLENGVEINSTTTNMNGEFTFTNVFGGSTYDVVFSLYGYLESSISISPTTGNIDMGDVILTEEFISPFDVVAEDNSGLNINWKTPKLSSKVKLQIDTDAVSTSYTNEPNENVWLGNRFDITEITTLTSVEIQTDIFQNAIDFVTIDVFDEATNTLLASSEPFLIQQDAVQTIDIPNIVVTDNIAVMVHWQNNPASTNSLILDFSPNIQNAAVIKYPNQNIELFSVFLANGAPDMAFHVRVNTLDDGSPVTNNQPVTYNVYRGLASEFPDITNWTQLNASAITNETIADNNTSGVNPNTMYRYAVETIYNEGFSEVTFSNEILGQQILSISDIELDNAKLIVFPNPAEDFINIKLEGHINITEPLVIYDITGKIVKEISPELYDLPIDISSFQSGIYFVKANANGLIINKKIIVK